MTDGENTRPIIGYDDRDHADEGDDAYFLHRAGWHENRAAVAQDDSTRVLHQRFARLYAARARH